MKVISLLACLAVAVGSAPAVESLYRGDVGKGEIEILEENSIFKNKWILFFNDKVRFPNGKQGTYIRVSRPHLASGRIGGTAVLAVTNDGKVVLEEVFRHPIRQWTPELPRGGWEPGETLQATGQRELLEETGYSCKAWRDLGSMFPETSLTDYAVALYLARECSIDAKPTEKTEAIRLTLVPWKGILNMAREGKIKDSISLAAILRAESVLGP